MKVSLGIPFTNYPRRGVRYYQTMYTRIRENSSPELAEFVATMKANYQSMTSTLLKPTLSALSSILRLQS
jgi:hypothetical protein